MITGGGPAHLVRMVVARDKKTAQKIPLESLSNIPVLYVTKLVPLGRWPNWEKRVDQMRETFILTKWEGWNAVDQNGNLETPIWSYITKLGDLMTILGVDLVKIDQMDPTRVYTNLHRSPNKNLTKWVSNLVNSRPQCWCGRTRTLWWVRAPWSADRVVPVIGFWW